MQIKYDKKVDAMYIKLNEKEPYHVSKKVTDDVLVDYSKEGKVIGVEVLSASDNVIIPTEKEIAVENI